MRTIRTTDPFYGTRDERGRRTRSHTGSSNARSDGARHILATTTRSTTSKKTSRRSGRRAKLATQADRDSATATSPKQVECDVFKEQNGTYITIKFFIPATEKTTASTATVQCDSRAVVPSAYNGTTASDVNTDTLLQQPSHALHEQQRQQNHPPTANVFLGTDKYASQTATSSSDIDVAATATDNALMDATEQRQACQQQTPRSNDIQEQTRCSTPTTSLALLTDYDGTTCWRTYLKNLLICAAKNGWSVQEKYSQLTARLVGDAAVHKHVQLNGNPMGLLALME